MKLNFIAVTAVQILFSISSHAGEIFVGLELRNLTMSANQAIQTDYARKNANQNIKLSGHTLESITEKAVTLQNGKSSTVVEIKISVATDYVADKEGDVPDWCEVTLVQQSSKLNAKNVYCSPKD